MLLWRKTLTLILLMAFLPASVLAAMPLKLCLGADGHRAIESAIGGGHHDTGEHDSADSDANSAALELSDCIDLSVLTLGSGTTRNSSDTSKSSSLDKMPPAVLNGKAADVSAPVCSHSYLLKLAGASVTNLFLVAHATDVLLN